MALFEAMDEERFDLDLAAVEVARKTSGDDDQPIDNGLSMGDRITR